MQLVQFRTKLPVYSTTGSPIDSVALKPENRRLRRLAPPPPTGQRHSHTPLPSLRKLFLRTE
ncbi:hypothetical protein CRG98_007441, partial [Punica granatum]